MEEKNESSDTFMMSMLEEVNLFEPTAPTVESYESIDNYYHKILDMDVFDFIRNDWASRLDSSVARTYLLSWCNVNLIKSKTNQTTNNTFLFFFLK